MSGLNIEYNSLVDIKKEEAINTLKKAKIDGIKEDQIKIYKMDEPYNYRNKVQYPVRNVNEKVSYGMFKERTHELTNIKECVLQDELANLVAKRIMNILSDLNFDGYNETTKKGDIKNIIVRVGKHTKEVLCVLVVKDENIIHTNKFNSFIDTVKKEFTDIDLKSIYINENENDDNVILSDKNICVYGKEYIKDKIGKYLFNISADSFFQVNTLQAEVLYNLLKERMNFDKDKTLLELFSGVGTIGIYLSEYVKSVTGIEIVKSAVDMTKLNIKENNIKNYVSIEGDAYTEAIKLKNENIKFDYVVVDPPRKGLNSETITLLKEIASEKIGYVSCNVSTLARDINLLSDKYIINSIDLVDMFPFTKHVECVVVLSLKIN